MRYKRIGYNINVMQQSACLVINQITVDSSAASHVNEWRNLLRESQRTLRHEILSSRCYFNMAAPIGPSTVTSNIEELSFYHLLFTPFADIAFLFLNHKRRQCDNYYNGVLNSKMSDVKNIYFVYSLFHTYNPK